MPRSRSRSVTYLTAGFFCLPFMLLLVYFDLFDIYDRHFFDAGVTVPYNLLRVVFSVYLFGAICVPGFVALSAIGGTGAFARLRPFERLTAGFFCGAALW